MKRLCHMALVSIPLLAINPAMFAQDANITGPHEFDVHLRNLETEKSEFEDLVITELTPQRSEIRDTLKQTITELDDHLVALRKDPQNEERKADYEKTLSKAITQVMGFLGDYRELEPRTLRQLDQMTKALEAARTACREQQTTNVKETTEYRQRYTDITEKLEDLAAQYADTIAADGTLPDDVDLEIRLLQADLSTAKQMAMFAELGNEDMQQTTDDLTRQLKELAQVRASLQVSFRRSQGQQMLLGHVAKIKRRRLSAAQMRTRIAALSKVIPSVTADLNQADRLIDRFLKHDLRQPTSQNEVATQAAPQGVGVQILKQYLNPKSQGENRETATASTK